jgi:hypothetical protein
VGGIAILSFARSSVIRIFILAFFALICATAQAVEAEDSGAPLFPVRIIEIEIAMPAAELHQHLEFYLSLGFNAFWVRSEQAGKWTAEDAPAGPRLEPRFLELADWCARKGIPIFLAINPLRSSAGSFVFSNPKEFKRLRKFCRLLRRETGVRDFVLSFKQAPLRLYDLRDIVRYGRTAAPAHLELAAALRSRLKRTDRLWLAPAISSDLDLDNPELLYSAALLEGLPSLDHRIGLVWSGPALLNHTISTSQIEGSRARLGDRPLLLHDRHAIGPEGAMISLAISLGPLRNREASIGSRIDAYLYCPMTHHGGSRLATITVADFLADPHGYDPQASWAAAMARLAGDDPSALKALKTQAMEWGGWIRERNYRSALLDNPVAAAEDLRDPAAVARWSWTAKRYPQRIIDLGGLQDALFRKELLDTMARRYAVARAMPTVRELRSRLAVGRRDTEQLLDQLRLEREQAPISPGARRALDRFLAAAGLASLL